jgi:hypothetical protein
VGGSCNQTVKEAVKMGALVVNIMALPETVFSVIGAERVAVSVEADKVVLTPAATDTAPRIKKPSIDEIFSGLQFDFGDDYRFNREEANNYE